MLYKDSMENKSFNSKMLMGWILYGIWHAILTDSICFYAITGGADGWSSPQMPNGEDLGFWFAGTLVYCGVVLVANLILFHKFHIHHWGGFVMFLLMIMALALILIMESTWPTPMFSDVSHILKPMLS